MDVFHRIRRRLLLVIDLQSSEMIHLIERHFSQTATCLTVRGASRVHRFAGESPQIFLEQQPRPNVAIVIASGAGLPGKAWPADYFVELSRLLRDEEIIVIGSQKRCSVG